VSGVTIFCFNKRVVSSRCVCAWWWGGRLLRSLSWVACYVLFWGGGRGAIGSLYVCVCVWGGGAEARAAAHH
jgi:hypothetical protein